MIDRKAIIGNSNAIHKITERENFWDVFLEAIDESWREPAFQIVFILSLSLVLAWVLISAINALGLGYIWIWR